MICGSDGCRKVAVVTVIVQPVPPASVRARPDKVVAGGWLTAVEAYACEEHAGPVAAGITRMVKEPGRAA